MQRISFLLASIVCSTAISACAINDEPNDVGRGEVSSAVVVRRGVDYSWARPSPSGLHSAGYTFAARYLSFDTTGKNITASEAHALQAAGVDVIANWENGASDALNGRARGVSDAQEAQRQALAAGMPADRPIYFSVDFDASAAQQAAINDYFDGVASVLGVGRTGAYGGFFPIKRLFDAGKITWGWQTFAWSGGQWDPRAQIHQVQNGVTIAGGDCDIDEAQTDDFGQWQHASPIAEPSDGIAPDFDGDGKPDLVATWTSGLLTAYLNTGSPGAPGFGTQMNVGSSWNGITRIIVADADHDGRPDLLGVSANGTLTAYLNTSSPGAVSFNTQMNIGSSWNNVAKVVVLDADNDGKQDLLGISASGILTAYLNTGTPGHPGFATQMNIGSSWNLVTKIVVLDADNDGKQDLIGVFGDGTLTAYLNTGTPGHPSFNTQMNIGSSWNLVTKLVVLDTDNDGKKDLIGVFSDGTMTAYLNTGTPGHPGFATQMNVGTSWNTITKIVVADTDNDGKQDLLGTSANGTLTAYLNTGTPGHPGFATQKNIGTGWDNITRIATVH